MALAHISGPADFTPVDWSIGELLQRTAHAHPERIALKGLRDPESGMQARWTYAEMLAETIGVARCLLDRFEPGDRVAIWAEGGPRWMIFALAAQVAGIVLVPINAGCKRDELRQICLQSQAKGLFHGRDNPSRDAGADGKTDPVALRAAAPLADLFAAAAGRGSELPIVDPHREALIIFTSGTTGNAKGATLSHYALVNAHKGFVERLAFEAHSTWMNCVPAHTIAGCAFAPLNAIWNAGTHLVLDRFDAGAFFRGIAEDQAAWAPVVPTMGVTLLEYLDRHPCDTGNLKALTLGGAPISPDLAATLEHRLGAHMLTIYGQSEASAPTTQNDANVPIEARSLSAGRPLGGREVRIADPESGKTLEVGETGEICIRNFVMSGYFGQPAETARALDEQGWLHTGDLGLVDEDGNLRINGRLKDMIITGGLNVYPREVEDILVSHPAVLEAAVFGVPDAKWGERIVAAVRPAAEAPASEDLRGFVAERLARHKLPSEFVFLQQFPLTPSGKIQKAAVREKYLEGC